MRRSISVHFLLTKWSPSYDHWLRNHRWTWHSDLNDNWHLKSQFPVKDFCLLMPSSSPMQKATRYYKSTNRSTALYQDYMTMIWWQTSTEVTLEFSCCWIYQQHSKLLITVHVARALTSFRCPCCCAHLGRRLIRRLNTSCCSQNRIIICQWTVDWRITEISV